MQAFIAADDQELMTVVLPAAVAVQPNWTAEVEEKDLERMARIGIEMLLKLIREESLEQNHVSLAPCLIVRESTAPPC